MADPDLIEGLAHALLAQRPVPFELAVADDAALAAAWAAALSFDKINVVFALRGTRGRWQLAGALARLVIEHADTTAARALAWELASAASWEAMQRVAATCSAQALTNNFGLAALGWMVAALREATELRMRLAFGQAYAALLTSAGCTPQLVDLPPPTATELRTYNRRVGAAA